MKEKGIDANLIDEEAQQLMEDYGSYRKYKDEWMEKLKKNITS